jgi:hypothetical protein
MKDLCVAFKILLDRQSAPIGYQKIPCHKIFDAPITEKVWTVLRPEFGIDAGKSAIIVRALYGLKSTGAAFCAHLASFMRQMGYTSCKADPDL